VEHSPEELREQFFAALDRPGDRSGRWPEIWRLIVEHPWYQAELTRTARRLVWRRRAPPDLADDIVQDAVLLLARELEHAVDLNVDRTLAESHFSGWLAKIIRRDCQQALRSRQSDLRQALPLPLEQPAQPDLSIDSLVDLSMAIAKLPTRIRTVVILHWQSWDLKQIAASLDISYWQANRTLRAGLAKIAHKA
jgi:RNA polymerase sigma factor (sigma-70 family)